MGTQQKEETDKLYYSISEVSELFELNPSTLRFWEKEFDVLKPGKNKKGNRMFTKKDIEHIARIVDLVKDKGFTIQGAKEQLKRKSEQQQQHPNLDKVIEKLQGIRARLIELGNRLED